MKALVLLFLLSPSLLVAQGGPVATPEQLAAVKAAFDVVSNNVFVMPGTFFNKLPATDQTAVKEFIASVERCYGYFHLTEGNYQRIAALKIKPESNKRFEIMKLLKEKEISQEAFDSYSVQLDEVLLRERKIQASILLEHPTIIATLKGERTDTRRQCDLAVSYLISGNDSSVSSR